MVDAEVLFRTWSVTRPRTDKIVLHIKIMYVHCSLIQPPIENYNPFCLKH